MSELDSVFLQVAKDKMSKLQIVFCKAQFGSLIWWSPSQSLYLAYLELFVWTDEFICPNWKMYLSELEMIFVQIANSIL